MRLHIAQNEKVIGRCIDNFELIFPGDNKWIIMTSDNQRDYVGEKKNITKCDYNSPLFWNTIGDITQYDKIIIHFLTEKSARFVCKINHPNIYWIEWGADLYNDMLQYKGYQLYEDRNTPRKFGRYRWLGPFYHTIHRFKLYYKQKKYLKAAKKIKFFVPDSMYDEYPLLLKYYPELNHLQYRDFFYYPINEILGKEFDDYYSKGSNIIIGNSASLTGNHKEILKLLSTLNLQDRKVIIPLSYGVTTYGNYIENYSRSILGERVVVLREYLSLNNYNDILKSANIFIYNNYRQEAVGNILVALYMGGKVFLNSRNPLLKFYKSLGLVIYEVDDLKRTDGFKPLEENEIKNNREILLKYYSRERQLNLIRTNF